MTCKSLYWLLRAFSQQQLGRSVSDSHGKLAPSLSITSPTLCFPVLIVQFRSKELKFPLGIGSQPASVCFAYLKLIGLLTTQPSYVKPQSVQTYLSHRPVNSSFKDHLSKASIPTSLWWNSVWGSGALSPARVSLAGTCQDGFELRVVP
jgi:hypothetical protein